MNSYELQLKMMNEMVEWRKSGKPVTVSTPDNTNTPIADFVWCSACDEFHITLGEPAPEVTREDLESQTAKGES